MKWIRMTALLLTLTTGFYASADATVPTKVAGSFSKVYAPEGFDSNDNVQIVGVGVFNNSCYRNAETSVKIDHEKKIVNLGPLTYQYSGYCLQVMLPFDRVVDLGILKAGTYNIVQGNNPQPIGKIDVRVSTKTEPDDSLYAPISQAFFQSEAGKNKVTLTGELPLSCLKITNVKFNVQPEVLVVQPIVEMVKNVPCEKGAFPFTSSTDVGAMKSGRYLMHIRSMNGKAINNLVDVK